MKTRQTVSFGIDLGGTSTRVGLFDEDMQLLLNRSMTTRVAAGAQACVEEMAAAMRLLCQQYATTGANFEVTGVGLGSPGPINLRTGVLGSLPNFPGWDYFPLREALAEATDLPVVLECDANAAAIAEWKLGAGAGTDLQSMAMITLGTGVGSGLILNGSVWHGMYGMGGELGHSTVEPHGPLCGCGSRGCLEMYTSASGLVRLARSAADSVHGSNPAHLRRLQAAGLSAREVAELAEVGDPAASAACEQFGFYLGLGIANLTSVLDLPMVVVGGGLAAAWPLFAPAMFRSLREYSVVYRLAAPAQTDTLEEDRTYIRPAKLGPSAGLLGAALLPGLNRMSSVLRE